MEIQDVVAACHRNGIPRVFISLNAATNCSCGHRQAHNILSGSSLQQYGAALQAARKGTVPSRCAYGSNYEQVTQCRITLSPSWQVPPGSSSAHHYCHPAATAHLYIKTIDTTVTGRPSVSVRHQYWYGPACSVDKICKYNKKCDILSLNTTVLNKQTNKQKQLQVSANDDSHH